MFSNSEVYNHDLLVWAFNLCNNNNPLSKLDLGDVIKTLYHTSMVRHFIQNTTITLESKR